jgi:hypothetical protein
MTEREALRLALEALEEINKLSIGKNAVCLPAEIDTAIAAIKAALEQQEPEPVAWLQFKDNEPPVVAPRDLGTPVFLGVRGGLAHDAGEKK